MKKPKERNKYTKYSSSFSSPVSKSALSYSSTTSLRRAMAKHKIIIHNRSLNSYLQHRMSWQLGVQWRMCSHSRLIQNMLKQPVVVVGEEEEWSGAVAVTKTYNEYKKTNLKTDCEDISNEKWVKILQRKGGGQPGLSRKPIKCGDPLILKGKQSWAWRQPSSRENREFNCRVWLSRHLRTVGDKIH